MAEPVRVHIAASPLLLQDVLARNLRDAGVEVTDSEPCLVAVVTPDRARDVHSKIVIVLGDSPAGEVHVLIDGEPAQDRVVDAVGMRDLVLDLADHVSHDSPSICPPRNPPADVSDAAPL